jgi:ribosomal protein S5
MKLPCICVALFAYHSSLVTHRQHTAGGSHVATLPDKKGGGVVVGGEMFAVNPHVLVKFR